MNAECINLGDEPEIDEDECDCPEIQQCPDPVCPDPDEENEDDHHEDDGHGHGSGDGNEDDEDDKDDSEDNENDDDSEEKPDNGDGGDDDEDDDSDDSGNETEEEEDVPCTDNQSCGLKQHNKYRKTHGSPPMELDDDLNAAALVFAEELAAKGEFYHDPNLQSLGHGENLYASWTSDPSAAVIDYAKAVDEWYNEVTDPGYDFETGGYQSGTGHFTQVVWKSSTKLGMAHATSSNGWIYYVAR